jgi:hypothetical protein
MHKAAPMGTTAPKNLEKAIFEDLLENDSLFYRSPSGKLIHHGFVSAKDDNHKKVRVTKNGNFKILKKDHFERGCLLRDKEVHLSILESEEQRAKEVEKLHDTLEDIFDVDVKDD